MDETDAIELAVYLVDKSGLIGYGVELVDLPAGLCGWTANGRHVVYLDRGFVEAHPNVIVRDVALHEIAHALAGDYTHGWLWKETATRLGCVHARFYEGS